MRKLSEGHRAIVIALGLCASHCAWAQADLVIRDTPADTGAQPNPDSGPMWLSEDIWVRTSADPNWRPQPFTAASPTWTPAAHQNPEYRDPRYGLPNFVYVRVRNVGSAASSGTEQLHLYWAKASSGLSWPTSWNDNYTSVCGADRLLGAEITKPRVNAATASAAERTRLRDAYIEVATTPAFALLASYSYWTKQQQVHVRAPEHHNPGFLPWHREFLDRLEVLLQEADPRVKLMYWQWSQDPTNTGGVNLYTASFMGASGRGTGGTGMGAPLSPALEPIASESATVVRNLRTGLPGTESDATALGWNNYRGADPAESFSVQLEEPPNHDGAHPYIGGTGGSMSVVASAARDPFFFLLHGKVDELWARWQRANLARMDNATAYGTSSTSTVIVNPLRPWNGVVPSGSPIDPWTTTAGFIVSKTASHRSVLSPPIYDTAPLTIPALAPGQAVILEIPWYPPKPSDYACLGDEHHYCLLGRVTPGITGETTDINANVRNNNNLAWKNIQVVDDFSGTMAAMAMLVANDTDAPMMIALDFKEVAGRYTQLGRFVQTVHVGLPAEILRRFEGDKRGFARSKLDARQGAPKDVQFLQMRKLGGTLDGLALQPGERFPLQVVFELRRDYKPSKEPVLFDVVQRTRDAVVGGVRFQLDVSQLNLVKERTAWRIASVDQAPSNWASPNFDDARWTEAPAPLGHAPRIEAMTGVPGDAKSVYARKRFTVEDPSVLRDVTLRVRYGETVAVFLNGKEVWRGDARKEGRGAAEKAFFPVRLPADLLQPGVNVLAAEVRGADDVVFDAALAANRADAREAPSVHVALDDALVRAGREQRVPVEAIDPDGSVRKVSLFIDDKPIEPDANGGFAWTPGLGAQRVRAVVEDDAGLSTSDERVVVGVENLPPVVSMQARPGASPGEVILTAEATDADGQVRDVEFFVADSDRFDAEFKSVGKRTSAPFEVTIQLPETEHRIVTVRATDDKGEWSDASTHAVTGTHHAAR